MKTTSSIRMGRLLGSAALLIGAAVPTFAQTASIVPVITQTSAAYVAEKLMADKGYWQLHVDAVTNATVIDFYGRDHVLVYQEAIPDRAVILNKENRQLLDQTTERLTNNRLLASAAKITGVEALPLATASAETVLTAYEMATRTGFRVNSYITPKGVLNVRWDNPDGDKVQVSLLSSDRQSLYNERSSTDAFRRKYNLSQLESGTYTLVVMHNRKPYTFQVSRQEGSLYRVEQKTPRTLASMLTVD